MAHSVEIGSDHREASKVAYQDLGFRLFYIFNIDSMYNINISQLSNILRTDYGPFV
jgi:hypothetical protein